jgi:hypothetical protein
VITLRILNLLYVKEETMRINIQSRLGAWSFILLFARFNAEGSVLYLDRYRCTARRQYCRDKN